MARVTNEEKELVKIIEEQPLSIYKLLGCKFWKKEEELVKAIEENDIVAVRSCHSSGKTYTLGRVVPAFLFREQDTIVLTTAPSWRQVEQLLWRQIRVAYNKSKIALGGEIFRTKIEVDDNWFALGLSTSEPEKFQGFHSSTMIVIIVDEASGVDDEIFEAIDGIMASGRAKLVMIGNPTKISGRFARAFKEEGVEKFKISVFDTPNFYENGINNIADLKARAGEDVPTIIQGLVTPKWAYQMLKRYGEDSDVFRVRVLGDFPKGEPDTLIRIDQVENAFERQLSHKGKLIIGVDVARYGGDWTVLIARQGNKVFRKEKFQKTDLMYVCGQIIKFCEEFQDYTINIDAIGIGAGVADRLIELNYPVNAVNVASKPNEAIADFELFKNLRAQAYWRLRQEIDHMQLPLIEGRPDDDWYQLTNIKYKLDSAGKIQIESKDELKKRGLESPDIADALMLTYTLEGVERFDPGKDIAFV